MITIDSKEFGRKLATLIKQSGYKRTEIAQKVKVHPNVIGYWCVGKRIPSLQQFVLLCNVFSVSANFFFEDEKQISAIADIDSMIKAIQNCTEYYLKKARTII